MMPSHRLTIAALAFFCSAVVLAAPAIAQELVTDDILIDDFESDRYDGWQVTGDAFGDGPADGKLPGQMNVTGFHGKGLVNSFHQGDRSTGTLTSGEFQIERPYINLLIGGGGYVGETEVQLLVDQTVVRRASGPNTHPGGSEALIEHSWKVDALAGKMARIKIVDDRRGGWGHINVDHIRQSKERSAAEPIKLAKQLTVDDGYLLVPVANYPRGRHSVRLNVYEGEDLLQDVNVSLPRGDDPYWMAAYPLTPFQVNGQQITIRPADQTMSTTAIQPAFDRIRVGSQDDAWSADEYDEPYRNQFHISTRRGWNNDPNGMVYHDGKYHLFYQHNPLGIFWGNMHWGHFVSTDLVHWIEKPIVLFQKTQRDMMFSGGGFVDRNNTAGYGENTLFVAFTSTGRGECLAYSTDSGRSFTEIPENPVVEHSGRDPKIIWYQPEKKWVMVVYNNDESELTTSTPFNEAMKVHKNANLAFYESKNLHQWTKTGEFTDFDRKAVFECPEFFELPVQGNPDQSRWCLMGASNRYFLGDFDGSVFKKESGPHGNGHGAFYAAQTFSDTPRGRRIQIGWAKTSSFEKVIPDQVSNQCFTLAHELTLRETPDGSRIFFTPVEENETLRDGLIAEATNLDVQSAVEMLQVCRNALTEVEIELSSAAKVTVRINGIDASFEGITARLFNDRVINEVYVDGGRDYRVNARAADQLNDVTTSLAINGESRIKSLRIYRLRSIF